jgi:uncharacterized membrane protein YfcA
MDHVILTSLYRESVFRARYTLDAASLNIIDAIGTSLLPVSAFGLTTAIRYSLEGQIQWFISVLFIAGA